MGYKRRARSAAVDGRPIPTKHCGLPAAASAPRRRAALTIISSSVVYSAIDAHALAVLGEVGGADDVLVDPGDERVAVLRDRIPRFVEAVVADRIAHRETRVGAIRHEAHRADDPGWQHDRAGDIRKLVDDFFDRHDRSRGGKHRLLLHTEQTPDLHVAVPIPTLGVDDADIGIECGYGGQHLARERALD